jgi:hypothetical protein
VSEPADHASNPHRSHLSSPPVPQPLHHTSNTFSHHHTIAAIIAFTYNPPHIDRSKSPEHLRRLIARPCGHETFPSSASVLVKSARPEHYAISCSACHSTAPKQAALATHTHSHTTRSIRPPVPRLCAALKALRVSSPKAFSPELTYTLVFYYHHTALHCCSPCCRRRRVARLSSTSSPTTTIMFHSRWWSSLTLTSALVGSLCNGAAHILDHDRFSEPLTAVEDRSIPDFSSESSVMRRANSPVNVCLRWAQQCTFIIFSCCIFCSSCPKQC